MTLLMQDIHDSDIITFPLPPEDLSADAEQAVYARFMRYLRCVPNSRVEIKVLSAIQFTGDILDYNDAQVAKILVDLGLRAPRIAFPAEFLAYRDSALMRDRHEVGAPNRALLALQSHWANIGEDPFAGAKRQYSLLDEMMYADR